MYKLVCYGLLSSDEEARLLNKSFFFYLQSCAEITLDSELVDKL